MQGLCRWVLQFDFLAVKKKIMRTLAVSVIAAEAFIK